MSKRKLEELNLLDDFLFGSMLTYPDIGEKFVRELLRTICGREFGKLTVIPQKVYLGSNTDCHGARLDVYLEEDPEILMENANIFDMEPDQNNRHDAIACLPKRVRYYHAMIDARILKTGEDYRKLKNVLIIMIMPYDPFGRDRMVYTIRSLCEEEPDMPYEDGAKTLFLYTKGKRGEFSQALRELLHYMEHTTKENAKNESLRSIQQMVDIVKHDKEVALEFMKIFEREKMLIDQGREEERINTEKERQRADEAEQEIRKLKDELEALKKLISLN